MANVEIRSLELIKTFCSPVCDFAKFAGSALRFFFLYIVYFLLVCFSILHFRVSIGSWNTLSWVGELVPFCFLEAVAVSLFLGYGCTHGCLDFVVICRSATVACCVALLAQL